ncbi:MAG: hypothetical protein KF886_04975 [Candidatus Hydrogenedentes bacterium]|nr:hypothetical protein [Candidatus Hydrogenedentota bacterium]
MQTARIVQIGLLALVASGALSGCGPEARTGSSASPQGEGEPAYRQATDQRASHSAPAHDAASASAIHEGAGAAGASIPPSRLTPELHAQFVRGLSLAEARALTAIAPVRIGGDGEATEIYRWTDGEGNHFTARFDSGVLRTKSGLGGQYVSRNNAPPRTPVAPPDTGGEAVAEIAPGVFIPLERAVAASTGQPRGIDNTPRPGVPESAAPPAQPPATTSGPAPGPQIAIAGDARAASSSYQPRANLPPFTRSLRDGRHEVRLLNPGNATIQAGLRQDKLGRDITIPPGGQASFQVERGVYRLYYIRESEPYTLHETDPLTLDGFLAPNVEVRLDPANVEMRLIDYSTPEQ